jgi:O-antigen/teichoic acid export membrane protein
LGAEATHDKFISRKSKHGFFTLFRRSTLTHLLKVASLLLLARWLTPKDYGVFGIIQCWISFSFYLCDIGLGSALIQQEEKPSEIAMRTTFTVQLFLSSLMSLIFFIAAPWMVSYYSLEPSCVWMIRTLAFTIPVFALRVVPRIHLERDINFAPIAKIELAESVCMYSVQIFFAWYGWGAWSLIMAHVTRAFVGSGAFLVVARVLYIPSFSKKEFVRLASFGIPMQLSVLVPAVKILIIPVILGSLLPIEKIGLITWAISLTGIPMALAANYNQVFFTALSRLKSNPEAQAHLAARGMELAFLSLGILFGLMLILGGPAIDTFFPGRWAAAKTIFNLAILYWIFDILRYLCASIFNANGQPMTRFWIEATVSVCEFVMSFIGVILYEEKGYFAAIILTGWLALIYTYSKVQNVIRTYTLQRLIHIGAISFIAAIIIQFMPENALLKAGVFLSIYFVGLAVLDMDTLKDQKWLMVKIRELF